MLEKLAKALKNLPGVGEKTAFRYAHAILGMETEKALDISRAIEDIKLRVSTCRLCNNITDGNDICRICSSPKRNQTKLMVLEDLAILDTIERTGEFNGLYYILPRGFSLMSGTKGSDPDHNALKPFFERMRDSEVREIIIATNPTLDGDTIGIYMAGRLTPTGIKVTRIAYGIPVGVDLGYVDDITLVRSLEGRREI